MTVKAIIFDYKTLLSGAGLGTRDLLTWAGSRGLRWCLFSTDPLTAPQQTAFLAASYPNPDEYIQFADIPSRKRRGSPDWVSVAAARLGVAPHELLYVGCTALDWRTAINAGVFYLHARWAARMPAGTTSYVADTPDEVRHILESFLLDPPRWAYAADGVDWSLRSLLPASAVLPCTRPGGTFKLLDVFKYDKVITIGDDDARDHLMLHVLANAYLEGLLEAGSLFCVYPGSQPGKLSEQLSGYIDKAAAVVHGFYRDDLLVRARQAPDTSLARYRANQSGRPSNVSIATQATTVHLGEKYRGKLRGKTVVVLDDFTTKGMSLEWARILLGAGDAKRVVMLTVGKYGTTHTRFELKPGMRIDPYALKDGLTAADFGEVPQGARVDLSVSRYFHGALSAAMAAGRT